MLATSEELTEALGHDWQQLWPKLEKDAPSIDSEATEEYNCVAWAASETDRWWWPANDYFWPDNVTRDETLHAFAQLFSNRGYEPCDDADSEVGYEKVALFADADGVTHASRQLPDGRWTSKLGSHVDISHELNLLEGDEYGHVVAIMRRHL